MQMSFVQLIMDKPRRVDFKFFQRMHFRVNVMLWNVSFFGQYSLKLAAKISHFFCHFGTSLTLLFNLIPRYATIDLIEWMQT